MYLQSERSPFAISSLCLAALLFICFSAPASAVDYFDDFARPDGTVVGDGWIEKQANAFSLAAGTAVKNQVGTAYRDNIIYRPVAEDLLDAEASVELQFLNNSVGYPQVLVRVQAATAATPNSLDAYILYMSNSTTQAVLGRQRGSAFVSTLSTIFLSSPLNTTDRFRMRIRAVGSDPVNVDAWIERLGTGGWEIIGQASVADSAANRVNTAGAVGFGGYIEASYVYDNFNRLDLEQGGPGNPVPVTSGLAPNNLNEGSSAFSLVVQGTDFAPGAVVRWNGTDRTTAFVSATELQASIDATDVATAGSATVTVFNQAPGGGESNPQTFTINALPGNPVPALANLNPDTAIEGSSAFVLTVDGSGFVPNSVVRWDGADRQTTYISATQLQAVVNATDIANAGAASVTVFSPAPGGGLSNALTFTVTSIVNNPAPTIVTLAPDSAIEGSSAFSLTVQGQDFIASTVVRWNGSDRTTTFVSATELQAAIGIGDIASAGSADVTVATPAPGGGVSNSLLFTVMTSGGSGGNTQTLTDISPQSTVVGSGAITLTLDGTGFTQNSDVQIGGIVVPTTFVTDEQLLADVDAGLLATGLRSAVTVRTPEADNTVTNPQTLIILESGEQLFTDNFNRPDNVNVANAWTEKDPGVFSLIDGEVSGVATNQSFNEVVVYRPIQEDAQNVEVGMEFVRTPGATSLYPQVHARVQRDTVTQPNALTSYTLFFDSYRSPNEIHITPILNFGECYIATFPLSAAFVEGERYRLRFRVTGTNPVELTGFMDRLNVDYWEVIGAGTVLHDQNTPPGTYCDENGVIAPITQSGATGFAKWRNASDRYDNFYSIGLGANSNPAPVTSLLTPNSTQVGSLTFTLAVQGSGFVPGSTVRWNGADRPTTFVSSTDLQASIGATDVATEGTASVTVFNPAPGGGLSNPQTFTITAPAGNPAPALASLTPDLVVVSSAGFTLAVDGANFVPGAVIRWNGADRPTSYISATQLQAAIDAADISAAGTATITVFNPAPGGGTSNGLALTILDPVTDYFDDFGRPDSAALGDGWIEKQPGAFSLAGGVAVKNAVSSAYRDNLVYRPAVEDLLDVEASVELTLLDGSVGYPQLMVRLQSNTAATPNSLDGYILYMNNSTTQAVLGRQTGSSFVNTLATLFLTSPLNTTDRFRLRMRAVGSSPVVLDAFVERLGTAGWEIIGQASANDAAANRIDSAGSVGFGGYVESSYTYDNFTRVFLTP